MALNWPGLFAWSTKYHDGTAPSNFKVMSDEDRRFLEQAMEEAFGKMEDPNQVFQEALDQIRSPERTDETISTALEVIDRLCDDPDVARNVEKLNGTRPLLDLIGSHPGPIRVRTLEILALLFSNNPHIQKVGVEKGALRLFADLVRQSTKGSEERSKAFRALVALIRQEAPFEEEFLRSHDGVTMLLDCMSLEESPPTREKTASFVRCLAGAGRLQAADVELLAATLAALLPDAASQSVQYRETIASSATELARAFPAPCSALGPAVQARLAQARGATDREDVEHEVASLLECLEALSGGGAAAGPGA